MDDYNQKRLYLSTSFSDIKKRNDYPQIWASLTRAMGDYRYKDLLQKHKDAIEEHLKSMNDRRRRKDMIQEIRNKLKEYEKNRGKNGYDPEGEYELNNAARNLEYSLGNTPVRPSTPQYGESSNSAINYLVGRYPNLFNKNNTSRRSRSRSPLRGVHNERTRNGGTRNKYRKHRTLRKSRVLTRH